MRRALALALATVGSLLPGQAYAASPPLECDNIRRLHDNFALDLRIRMEFDPRHHRYARFEDVGRGWHFVGVRRYIGVTADRIRLDETPFSIAYVERLTGDYYAIDRSNTTLSVWGRCNRVGPVERLF